LKKLLNNASGAAQLSPDKGVQSGLTNSAAGVARSMCGLIEVGKLNRSDDILPKLEEASAKVTGSINQMVSALQKLPNAQDIKLEDDKGDLDKVAEEELLNCANIIKKAAETLANAKRLPAKKIPGVLDKMDINNAILDAAQAIATATSSLVTHAYSAQQERVKQKYNRRPGQPRYNADPTWASGLISASHSVAGSVQYLVQAANKASQGNADEDELVVAARNVASSTAHLVSASRAKSDQNSVSQKSLSEAAKQVAAATSQLVAAARNASVEEEEEEDLTNFQFGSGAKARAKELEQQMRILKLEKELERERTRMGDMRKDKYKANK